MTTLDWSGNYSFKQGDPDSEREASIFLHTIVCVGVGEVRSVEKEDNRTHG